MPKILKKNKPAPLHQHHPKLKLKLATPVNKQPPPPQVKKLSPAR